MLSFLWTRFPTTPSGIIFNSIHNYLEIMFPIDVLRFSEFRTMRNHLLETLMLNDIQIPSDYMSRKYVIVPADKAFNNIVFVCKSYYFECLIKELGINNNTSSNTTYKPTSFDKDEILANHRSFMTSLNIPYPTLY
jgi:hypothetical protein